MAEVLLIPSLCWAGGDERGAWLRRVEVGWRNDELYATRALDDFAAHNATFHRSNIPPPANYAEDPTLRQGDVVVTNQGMVAYFGAPNEHSLPAARNAPASRLDPSMWELRCGLIF